ncbi:MAG: hypothetical protein JSW47_06570 [Phycisphaerales bacterium]|nr:MAG: hypothetical protein JSW47_06570 [Phycisphaerales bacterium]
MRSRGKRNSFFGLVAGGLLWLFGRTRAEAAPDDLRRADLTTSTQRLGVRFGERIRDVFRFRWLRISHRASAGTHEQAEQSDEQSRIQ